MAEWVLPIVDSLLDHPETTLILQLVVALAIGMLLGAERTLAGKTAGVRTHALVAMTATLFTTLALRYLEDTGRPDDLFRVIQGVATGIGFLGAGIILFHDNRLRGLTTAAGLWFTAALGVAVGLGYYGVAFAATAIALFVYRILWSVEQEVKEIFHSQAETSRETQSQA